MEARRIIARYAKRWVIEEFHKALKSGAHVEKSELETAERLKALLGVLVVVAVRLDYLNWEDTSGLPGQILMRADRRSALAGYIEEEQQ